MLQTTAARLSMKPLMHQKPLVDNRKFYLFAPSLTEARTTGVRKVARHG
jgi:hypothetical protein